jgi:uncharacterized membrane protein
MKNKTIGLALSALGLGGTLIAVFIINFVKPCCTVFMDFYHQMLEIMVPIFMVVLILGVYLYFKEKAQPKQQRTKVGNILLEDEKKVLKAIKGETTQAKLRNDLGMSKAKLSMLLEKMQKRGMVKKVRRGRTNIVVKRKF